MTNNDLQYDAEQKRLRHLLTIEGLPKALLLQILDKADGFIAAGQAQSAQLDLLKDKTLANLFFENSTRTRASFELAAKRLGATVLNLDINTSATQKGETVLDTVQTLEAMHCNVFVIRHSKNNIVAFIAARVQPGVVVLNAGDGTHAHPTQALVDMLTIRQHKKDFANLTVAIVGDIVHSRVAQSDIAALKTLGVKNIRLIGPAELAPEQAGVTVYRDFVDGLQDVDVVMMLRIQKERMQQAAIPSAEEYFQLYGLTAEKLTHAKPDAIVMHPGPMNRGIEIDDVVADGKQSVIFDQVSNGVAVRMAVMALLCEK